MRVLRLLPASLLVSSVLLAAPAAGKGVHKDPRIGFQFKPPRGWTEIPTAPEEQWIVAKYQSPKKDRVYDKEQGWSYSLNPELVAVAFLDEAIKHPDVGEDEDRGETGEVKVRLLKPMRGYEDYLKRTLSGYFIEKDEEDVVKGTTVRKLSVLAEDGDKSIRYLAWVFPTEVGKVAIQLDCFDASFDKLEPTFLKVLRSFKTIERTKSLDIASRTGDFLVFELASLAPDARGLRRQEQEDQEWRKIAAGLPEGWKAKEIKGVRVANHADDKLAKKVVERVLAVRRWLDATFPEIGPEEYARVPIIRICESLDEERSFLRQSPRIGVSVEIVTHKDTTSGSTSSEWAYVSRRTMELWFADRDLDLWLNMPQWIQHGLRRAVEDAEVKRKTLAFDNDLLKQQYRRSRGNDEPLPLKTLFGMTPPEYRELQKNKDYRYGIQSSALVLCLLTDRSKKLREVMPRYLASARAVLDEIRKDEKGDVSHKKPTNEKEEEAYFEEQRRCSEERQQRLLQEAMSRTFSEWSAADWKSLDRAYRKLFL